MVPHRDSQLPGLVGEVGGDAGAGEGDETGGQRFEHLIVALEGRGLGVLGPVGLEDDLRDLVVIGPAGGDARSCWDAQRVTTPFARRCRVPETAGWDVVGVRLRSLS